MELKILSAENKESGKKKLPKQFDEEIRPDLVKKAFEAVEAGQRQPYGANPRAGKRASAKLSRKRNDYRGAYGHGISRVPRKIMTRRGTRFNWVGAVAPGTVGGRRAHAPKAEKDWTKKINKKERRKAIRSAMAATLNLEIVKAKGHKAPESYPFIIDSKIEEASKAKDAKKILEAVGLKEELARVSKRTIRAGRGKSRGRKYKTKTGPLLVVSSDCGLSKSGSSIPGVEVVNVKKINAQILAPGAKPGRLALFTEKAIDVMEKENLFM
jgi:large subunit ribosomal protein L4e